MVVPEAAADATLGAVSLVVGPIAAARAEAGVVRLVAREGVACADTGATVGWCSGVRGAAEEVAVAEGASVSSDGRGA